MTKRTDFNIVSVDDMLKRNEEIIQRIKEKNREIYETSGKQLHVMTITYGCQMNEHDSENLKGMLLEMGYLEVNTYEEADLIIFNTCCVRENAELKVFGNLGHIKKIKEKKPDLILAVCGCMMQQPHIVEQIKKTYKHVDLVFGTHNLHNFPSLLLETMAQSHQVVEIWDTEGEVIEGLPVDRKFDVKAYVNIMYGCNNFCSYCIVPYTRGRERSRDPKDVVEEVTMLVSRGVKEVMLLGQNVNSFGKTLKIDYDFSDLLRDINEIPGIERIRFMTSHPKDISDKLIQTMAECEHICESLHLPVQAGSNRTLKAMNRNYTREFYLENINKAKASIPGLTVSTDIIVGFPGETEADFQETLSLINTVGYDTAYTFIYSKRTGTPAAEIEDQISEDIKHDRFKRLLEVTNPMIKEKVKTYQDQIVEVLVENVSKQSDDVLMGRTRGSLTVNFKGSKDLIGKMVMIKVTNPKNFSLFGEVVEVIN